MCVSLPAVYEKQLAVQLPTASITVLSQALQYATDVQLPAIKFQLIVNRLMQTRSDTWTDRQTIAVLRALERIENLEEHGLLPLMDTALEQMAQLVGQCDLKNLDWLVALTNNFSHRNPYWYNESLCSALAERTVREKRPLHFTAALAQNFQRMAYVHIEFLEYYSKQIIGPLSRNVPFQSDFLFRHCQLQAKESRNDKKRCVGP